MRTPSLSHLSAAAGDYDRVYEPSDDSFLLLDALENDASLIASVAPSVALEVGSGSGVVSAFLSFLWPHVHIMATDINPFAAAATKKTGHQNSVHIDAILTQFATGLLPRLHKKIDILIFNPPYVVTPSSEIGGNGIEASWAGGIDGREVLDKFIPAVDELLSPNGIFYLVTVNENKPTEIMDMMETHYGIHSKMVLRRRAGIEGLGILRMSRNASVAHWDPSSGQVVAASQ
ncbi:HemK methyltransferase member 2 [Entophlyctis luteolus]|nr:HemK methyltransferase member 2 [Entophlyctis luteolus]KAJ3394746.1 HemK methyltransferase member 2 [Entophlyctis sp. JEL0112]